MAACSSNIRALSRKISWSDGRKDVRELGRISSCARVAVEEVGEEGIFREVGAEEGEDGGF